MKKSKECPLSAFISHIDTAQNLLEELREYFDNHMDASPEDVRWGHVGSAAHVIGQLQEIQQFLGLKGKADDHD